MVELQLDFSVRRVYASPKISADSGKVCFTCGPLVYCAEGADNEGGVLNVRVLKGAQPEIAAYDSSELFGIRKIRVAGVRVEDSGELYTDKRPLETPCTLTLIPYYAWANRGVNEMRVWLPEETAAQ